MHSLCGSWHFLLQWEVLIHKEPWDLSSGSCAKELLLSLKDHITEAAAGLWNVAGDIHLRLQWCSPWMS
jgi:hypothetical protein